MKNLILGLMVLFIGGTSTAQSINELYKASMDAKSNGDFQKFKELNLEVLKKHPSQPTILYNTSVAYQKLHMPDSSRFYMEKLISWNTKTQFKEDDFDFSVPDSTYWKNLEQLKHDYEAQIETSEKSFEIEGMHHIEDILVLKKDIYLTDIKNRALLKIDRKTKAISVIMEFGQYPIALALDQNKGSMWVSLGNVLDDSEHGNESFLYEIDLASGKKISEIELPPSTLLGSMISIKDRLWATNSKQPQVLIIDTEKAKLLETIEVGEAYNLQGITWDKPSKQFYISDYIKGICSFDLKNPSERTWYSSKDFLLKGFDGLLSIGNSKLIAIQNNSRPNRVVLLDIDSNNVVKVDLIDNNLGYEGEPTNMCFEKGKGVYYIANSAWPFYNKEKKPIAEKWENQEIRFIPIEKLMTK